MDDDSQKKHVRAHKVCVIGSGNWASAISRVVGINVLKYPEIFDPSVAEWVFEEIINGQKISDVINAGHINVKYLPGVKLPENVVAIPDFSDAVKSATILVFAVPNKFLKQVCQEIKGKIVATAIGVSLCKGIFSTETNIQLVSDMIAETLKIRVSVLMGATIANEVADEQFSEATVASRNRDDAILLKRLFETNYFRITTSSDVVIVELYGALKNIVALAAGFVDGLELGLGTKATVLRLGFMEMIRFVDMFHPGSHASTFLLSSGIGDVITTCYGGRNHLVAKEFVKTYETKSIEQVEKELLNGQHLQGPATAAEINVAVKRRGLEKQFPLFTAVHHVCSGVLAPMKFVNSLRNHPEFSISSVSKKDFLPEPNDYDY